MTVKLEHHDAVAILRGHQDYRCAICNIHEDQLARRLYVDHDHATGLIRGLLCPDCNSAEGHGNQSDAMVAYRENPPTKRLHIEAVYVDIFGRDAEPREPFVPGSRLFEVARKGVMALPSREAK